MEMTKDVLIIAALLALIVLLVMAIRLVYKWAITADKLNEVLDDSKEVSSAAVDAVTEMRTMADQASEVVDGVTSRIRNNIGIIQAAGAAGTAFGSIRSMKRRKREAEEREAIRRERRAARARRRMK